MLLQLLKSRVTLGIPSSQKGRVTLVHSLFSKRWSHLGIPSWCSMRAMMHLAIPFKVKWSKMKGPRCILAFLLIKEPILGFLLGALKARWRSYNASWHSFLVSKVLLKQDKGVVMPFSVLSEPPILVLVLFLEQDEPWPILAFNSLLFSSCVKPSPNRQMLKAPLDQKNSSSSAPLTPRIQYSLWR